MKLWKISQTENDNYDSYDSAVVAAEDEATARAIHPEIGLEDTSDMMEGLLKSWKREAEASYGSWCKHPDQVTVEYIGEAKPGTKMGVIVVSYRSLF
jgi:hypothetical protein